MTLDSSGNSTTVYFEPEGNYTGSTFFSIRVSEAEDQNASDLIYFNVEVEPIEDSPVFESYPSTLDAIQGYSWQYEIFAVDGDSEQDLEITTESTLPPWLNLSQISKGRALFGTPFNGQIGDYPISLTVLDEIGNSQVQNFTLRVLSENTTPLLSVSGTNEFNILEDQVWTGDFFVTDPDRQNIFWFLQNNPANGTVIFEPENGENVSVSYTPDGNYSGSDSFTVGVTDGIASANASFEILIEEVSDIPIFELFLHLKISQMTIIYPS